MNTVTVTAAGHCSIWGAGANGLLRKVGGAGTAGVGGDEIEAGQA